MSKDSISLRFAARPSFFEGMARLLDIGSTLQVYSTDQNEEVADANAIAHDWKVVGDDLRGAIHFYEQKLNSKQRNTTK